MKRESPIGSAVDIVTARQTGRTLAMELGFDGSDLTVIATAISEVARNIVDHAKQGEIIVAPVNSSSKHGIQIVARDDGPGISGHRPGDAIWLLDHARDWASGCPGAKWLMDEFDIDSKVGKGTTVTMKKWLH